MGVKSRLQLRNAHGEGAGSVVWESSGKHLITGGADGRVLVHSWDPAVPSSTVSMWKPHNVAITAIALSPNGALLASGSTDHSVKLHKYPGGDYQSTVTRFTLPLRSLAFSITGGLLAAAGDDDGIKLISMADNSIARILKGHGASVVSVAFDPKNEYIASSDTHGTIIIWLISSGKQLHTLEYLAPRIEVDSECRNTVAWHPDGNLLAVPGLKNTILLLDRDTAEEMGVLRGGHTSNISCLAWSPNGKYLISSGSGTDKQIVLWDAEKQQDIDGLIFDVPVCSLSWKPVENAVAVFNMNGQFSVWESVVPPHMVSPTIVTGSFHVSKINFEELHKYSDDEGSQGNGHSIDLGSQDTASGDDEGGEESDVGGDGEVRSCKKREIDSLPRSRIIRNTNVDVMQASFQPGSTAKAEDRRWFLAYNLIGSISSIERDSRCHVEVEFHDVNRGTRIPAISDHFGFTMAALGEKGSIFASAGNDEKSPSILVYRPFNSWASNSEWSIRFSDDEQVRCVAIGDGWVAAATSHFLLRVVTEGGLQRFRLSLSGPVVTMAGHQHSLLVVSHASAPLPSGDQVMEFMLLDVQTQSKICCGRLPLSPGAKLLWIGFGECGGVASYDSNGVLRRYFTEFGGSWIPIFSVEKERKSSEFFWMVGFNDTQIFSVICKLPLTEPLVSPRPVLTVSTISLPLGKSDFGGDEVENTFLQHSLLLNEYRATSRDDAKNIRNLEMECDKDLLRLIAIAGKGERMVRVMELASLLQLPSSLEGAIKLIKMMHIPALTERLSSLLEMRRRLEEQTPQLLRHTVSNRPVAPSSPPSPPSPPPPPPPSSSSSLLPSTAPSSLSARKKDDDDDGVVRKAGNPFAKVSKPSTANLPLLDSLKILSSKRKENESPINTSSKLSKQKH